MEFLAKSNKGGSDHVPETPDKNHAHLEALADQQGIIPYLLRAA
jgi:hypothetical protein